MNTAMAALISLSRLSRTRSGFFVVVLIRRDCCARRESSFSCTSTLTLLFERRVSISLPQQPEMLQGVQALEARFFPAEETVFYLAAVLTGRLAYPYSERTVSFSKEPGSAI